MRQYCKYLLFKVFIQTFTFENSFRFTEKLQSSTENSHIPFTQLNTFFFLNLFNLFLFLTVLGLHCCVRAFSSCGARAFSSWGKPGLLFVAVQGLLIVVTSPVAEHGL